MDAPAAARKALEGLSPELRAVYDRFAAIKDPIERAAAITAWGRPKGNLRQPFVWLRAASLAPVRIEADQRGWKLERIARRVGISATRLSRLAPKAAQTTEAAA